VGEPGPDTARLLNVRDTSELQRRFQAMQGKQQAEGRRQKLAGGAA